MEEKTFYITTAIPYASRKPHIGNTYEAILTDAIARYKKAQGFDVFFMTGTDEHGQKIEDCAKEAGVSPKEYANGVSEEIKRLWDLLGVEYDHFIKTTDDYHEEAVKGIFQKLYDQGDIYKSSYEGWYCVPDESFYTDTQAKDGVCPDCGRPLKRAHEDAYFFNMKKYSERLIQYIEDHPDFIVPASRKNEMINNFLKPGLQDLCVTRSSFKWGVQVPFDPEHVIYVWIDALSNYITGLGYQVDKQGDLFQKYWPADVHIIGKDILRFHTIYWPIILMALGLPLPKQVFGHPWLTTASGKMSKSKGNTIYADDLVNYFGRDGVRYYVLSEMPYANDGTISYENVVLRFNTDLANTLGNLLARTLSMTKKYFDGVIPEQGEITEIDSQLISEAKASFEEYCKNMDEFKLADALDSAMDIARRANKYIDETTPWALAKDESQKARLGSVIYNLLESLRILGVILRPAIPDSCDKLLESLGVDEKDISSASEFGKLKSGNRVGESFVLFARLDEAKILEQIEKANGAV
ncbi:MAG: methionine--tRNA ligase [Clostridiales bacterium]|nr:methionine--tRNA ligase [Clostridiales bacterium]